MVRPFPGWGARWNPPRSKRAQTTSEVVRTRSVLVRHRTSSQSITHRQCQLRLTSSFNWKTAQPSSIRVHQTLLPTSMTSNNVNVKSKTLALLSKSRFELSSLVDNNKPLALRECANHLSEEVDNVRRNAILHPTRETSFQHTRTTTQYVGSQKHQKNNVFESTLTMHSSRRLNRSFGVAGCRAKWGIDNGVRAQSLRLTLLQVSTFVDTFLPMNLFFSLSTLDTALSFQLCHNRNTTRESEI